MTNFKVKGDTTRGAQGAPPTKEAPGKVLVNADVADRVFRYPVTLKGTCRLRNVLFKAPVTIAGATLDWADVRIDHSAAFHGGSGQVQRLTVGPAALDLGASFVFHDSVFVAGASLGDVLDAQWVNCDVTGGVLVKPAKPVPLVAFDTCTLAATSTELWQVWLGAKVVEARFTRTLVDPVTPKTIVLEGKTKVVLKNTVYSDTNGDHEEGVDIKTYAA